MDDSGGSRGGTARDRVIGAALALFAEHGVRGTSLRMIADRLGVAKGAVYYQFRSKDELLLALVQPLYDGLDALIETAETRPSTQRRRAVMISGLIDLAIDQRQSTCLFRWEPAVDELVGRHPELRAIADRCYTLMLGPTPDPAARVSLSVALAGLYYCTTDPALQDLAEPDLREILLRCFTLCVSGPAPPAASPPRPAAMPPGAALRGSVPYR